jgi:formylglycine-generating enzyme required for sulfatase activity
MRLTGEQLERARVGLLAAFSRDELRRLLKVAVEADLEAVTGDKGLGAQIFDVLLWLERQGLTQVFLAEACAANPRNAQLSAVAAALHAGAPGGMAEGAGGGVAGMLGIVWAPVAAGVFVLGSDRRRDPWAQPSELPAHPLALAAFQISVHLVTNYQYQVFVLAAGHAPPPHWPDGAPPPARHDHPVVNISWHEAQAFCRWAGVRLPNEAEWELAARGPEGRIWPWGDEAPTPVRCNYGLKVGATTPVGLFPSGASPYGVLDMAGNAAEWTSSVWLPYPYNKDAGREDPEHKGLRTVRGGSYDCPAREVRGAQRSGVNPQYGYDDVGMRVVL